MLHFKVYAAKIVIVAFVLILSCYFYDRGITALKKTFLMRIFFKANSLLELFFLILLCFLIKTLNADLFFFFRKIISRPGDLQGEI